MNSQCFLSVLTFQTHITGTPFSPATGDGSFWLRRWFWWTRSSLRPPGGLPQRRQPGHPGSCKWLGSPPIYEPCRPFGRGTTLRSCGTYIPTMATFHHLRYLGCILQEGRKLPVLNLLPSSWK